jgi:hypothetical protein
MKFFVPKITNETHALEIHKESIKYIEKRENKDFKIYEDRSIYSIKIQINEINNEFTVGDKNNRYNELVIFIFETSTDFILCTTNFSINGGMYYKISKINQYEIDYFNKMEFKYKEWTYSLDFSNNHVVNSPLIEPNSLFKYYSNNHYNREAIVNNYLFCSHPYHLNDPIDFSSLIWDFSNLTKERFNDFFIENDIEKNVSYEVDRDNNFEYIKTIFWEIRTDKSGIISLSANESNTLMWAHYSTENGFLVEFDKHLLINGIMRNNRVDINNYVFMPIQYVNQIEPINFCNESFQSPDIPLLYALNIKRDDWKYENEWRIVCYSEGFGIPKSILKPDNDIKGIKERKLKYSKYCVKSIVLGLRFFCGNTIEKVINDDTFEVNKSDGSPSTYTFLNHLYEFYNDRLFICEYYDLEKSISRKRIKIILEKPNENSFKIIKLSQ